MKKPNEFNGYKKKKDENLSSNVNNVIIRLNRQIIIK